MDRSFVLRNLHLKLNTQLGSDLERYIGKFLGQSQQEIKLNRIIIIAQLRHCILLKDIIRTGAIKYGHKDVEDKTEFLLPSYCIFSRNFVNQVEADDLLAV